MNILTHDTEQALITNPINQTEKHSKLTDKYQLIRTDKVIEVFQDNGLEIIGKSFAGTRNVENQGFQKHLIAFSSDNLKTSEGNLQLLLTNSHNGSCSYQLDLGFFRTVCANGLIDGNTESQIRIKHVGDCLNRLDKAIQYQLKRLPNIAAEIDKMRSVNLENAQIAALTFDAAKLRTKGDVKSVFEVNPRRWADQQNDLWTVFNRIQEAVIRGGLQYVNKEGEFKRTRKVSAVSTVTKLNKELWNLADNYAKAA